ncbi:MAG: hypothetical protein V3U84_11080 [Thiotrichaceae bacterium]
MDEDHHVIKEIRRHASDMGIRVSELEKNHTEMKIAKAAEIERQKAMVKRLDKIDSNTGRIVWIFATAILMGVFQMLTGGSVA